MMALVVYGKVYCMWRLMDGAARAFWWGGHGIV